jgi:hypothetical protein
VRLSPDPQRGRGKLIGGDCWREVCHQILNFFVLRYWYIYTEVPLRNPREGLHRVWRFERPGGAVRLPEVVVPRETLTLGAPFERNP